VKGCIEAHTESQPLRRSGHLRAAREKLVQCAQETCPAMIKQECGTLLGQLDAALPTVVVELRGDTSNPKARWHLAIDGEPFDGALAGRALPLDPGEHKVRVERTKEAFVEQSVTVFEGERARKLVVDVAAIVPTPPPDPTASASVAGATPVSPSSDLQTGMYVVGGVTIASLAAAGIFWALKSGEFSRLHDTCGKTGSCTDEDEQTLHRDSTLTAVSLGVSLVSLGTTVTLYLLHENAKGKSAALSGFSVQHSASTTALSWRASF
jgi:hypothetical protein